MIGTGLLLVLVAALVYGMTLLDRDTRLTRVSTATAVDLIGARPAVTSRVPAAAVPADPATATLPVRNNPVATAIDPAAATTQQDQIVQLVNDLRRQQGLATLQTNTLLTRAAQQHSDDMVSVDVLSHTGSDGSQPGDRARQAGYQWSTVGENVLFQPSVDAQDAFESWYNSPPHYDNMVNPAYTEIGIAYSRTGAGVTYYTMLLGRPR